jgi:L-fuconolactonase
VTVDTHFHLWELARPECQWPTEVEASIYRNHLLPEFSTIARQAGIAKAVLVQSQEASEDTEWLLAQTAHEPLVGAVVGWTDLQSPDVQMDVRALAVNPRLRGLRPMVQGKQDDWYDQAGMDAAAAAMVDVGLRLDALVRVRHLASLERLASRFPALPIVIDHAAKPEIGTEHGYGAWHDAMLRLAARPNVYCKLSGLLTECPPDRIGPHLIEPYVAALLDLFGAERLMWGSDWPVLAMAGNYADWLSMARDLVPASAHEDVFDGTARAFYGLERSG